MTLKKYLNKAKLNNIFIFMVLGFVIGIIVTYLYFQPKLTYQGKSVVDWEVTAGKNSNDNNQLKQDLQTMKTEILKLQNAPTPTPIIKYITEPAKSHITTCYTYNQGTKSEFSQCQ